MTVALGELVSVRLMSSAGVRLWQLSAFSADPDVLFPVITQATTVSGTATFTAPSTPTDGWALLFQSQVGVQALGRDAMNGLQASYTTTFGVYTPTVVGGRVFAKSQTYESSAAHGWAKDLNALAKAPPGAGGPPTGAAAGDWAGTFPSGTNKRINNQFVPWKSSVRAVATSNISLSGSHTVDGLTLTNGVDRVLVTAQTTPSQNGIYLYNSGGAWPRASDMSTSQDTLPGSKTHVYDGTTWANTTWTLTTQGAITLGTTSLTFTPDRAISVASLRLVAGKVQGETIQLAGYYSPSDGGGGTFVWKTGVQPTDIGGIDIVPAVTTSGWWQRLYSGVINVKWFGAKGDGATDDQPVIQALLSWLATNNISAEVFFPASSSAYRLAATLTIDGSLNRGLTIRGENTTPDPGGANGTLLLFDGASGTDCVIDLRGGYLITLERFNVQCSGKAKYGLWIRPRQDSSPLGAHGVRVFKVGIREPQNVDGAAAVAAGAIGGTPTQASEIYFHNCEWLGLFQNSGFDYRAVGFVNLAGGNVKDIYFTECLLSGFKHALDLTLPGGPVVVQNCGFSSNYASIFRLGSGRTTVIGANVETNYRNCKWVSSGGQGALDGSLTLIGGEFHYQDGTVGPAADNDRAIEYQGGGIYAIGGHFQNERLVAITGVTNTNPAVLTVPSGHSLRVGQRVNIFTVGGSTGVNTAHGSYSEIAAVTSTTVTINVAAGGVYTSGGVIQCEPEIWLQAATDASGGYKAGIQSFNNTWIGPAAVDLPIFDLGTGQRALPSAAAQARPVPCVSMGDVFFQEQYSFPKPVDFLFGKSPRFCSLPAGVGHLDASGNLTSSGVVNADVPAAAAITYDKFAANVVTVTGTHTMASTTTCLKCNISSGSQVITLPLAAQTRRVIVRDVAGLATLHPFNLVGQSGAKIERSSFGLRIDTADGGVELQSDGTDWWIIPDSGWSILGS